MGAGILHHASSMEERCELLHRLGAVFYQDPFDCPDLDLAENPALGGQETSARCFSTRPVFFIVAIWILAQARGESPENVVSRRGEGGELSLQYSS